jgi:hypothetical protein
VMMGGQDQEGSRSPAMLPIVGLSRLLLCRGHPDPAAELKRYGEARRHLGPACNCCSKESGPLMPFGPHVAMVV